MPAERKIDIGKLIKLRTDGLSYGEIAKELGVTKSAIPAALKRIKKCPRCGSVIY